MAGWFDTAIRNASRPGGPLERALQPVILKAQTNAKTVAAQEHFVTGEYLRSIHTILIRPFEGPTGFAWALKSAVKQAVFLEHGTKAHPIFGKPYLAWTPKDGGSVVIVRADVTPVNHPGTRPYRVLNYAVQEAIRNGHYGPAR